MGTATYAIYSLDTMWMCSGLSLSSLGFCHTMFSFEMGLHHPQAKHAPYAEKERCCLGCYSLDTAGLKRSVCQCQFVTRQSLNIPYSWTILFCFIPQKKQGVSPHPHQYFWCCFGAGKEETHFMTWLLLDSSTLDTGVCHHAFLF